MEELLDKSSSQTLKWQSMEEKCNHGRRAGELPGAVQLQGEHISRASPL